MSLITNRRMSDYDRGWSCFNLGTGLPACAPRNMVQGYNRARAAALAYNEAAFKEAKRLAEYGRKPKWMDEIAARIADMPERQTYWDQHKRSDLEEETISARKATLERYYAAMYARNTHKQSQQEPSDSV